MSHTKLHVDEVEIHPSLVRSMLNAQFPAWAELPVRLIDSLGTDNVIYRLGDELALRLPRTAGAAERLVRECQWLPRLSPFLPLVIPEPMGQGLPSAGYPYPWAIYRWLNGENATVQPVTNPSQAAIDLGHFITALEHIDTTGAPGAWRTIELAHQNKGAREAITAVQGIYSSEALTAEWDAAVTIPAWPHAPVWLHADLMPGNLLVQDDKISAVIDFGLMGVGDPAWDLLPAWSLFTQESREIFRNIVAPDNDTWNRGRGWALAFGLSALPYYQHTHPMLANIARRTIEQVLESPRD